MKVISTNIYIQIVEAQTVVDWDDPEAGPVPVEEFFDDQDDERNLPVIRQEDLHDILEDDLELGEEVVPKGAPAVEEEEPVPAAERPTFNNQYEALEWAENNNETIQINYTTKGGVNLTRTVEPHGQFYASGTHRTILVTYDRTVGAIRAFIMRNINGMDFTGKRFQKRFIVSSR